MKLADSRNVTRGGFTLIELLVVIAIISILLGITVVAVFKYLSKGPEINNRHNVSQLSLALGEFKAKFGDYPPSRIVLRPRVDYYNTTPANATQAEIDRAKLEADSVLFLKKMFTRFAETGSPWAVGGVGVNWGAGTAATSRLDLQGHQCLVFFLGGMQTGVSGTGGTAGCLGFSTNPLNPTALGGTRIGPFFDFKSQFLTGTAGSFAYNDSYGTRPYAYFSSGKSLNGYARYPGLGSDCASLGVSPYLLATGRYHAPDSFQIISAGADKTFGPGGGWTAVGAASMSPAGKDDVTNFYNRLMGVPE